MSKHQSYNSAAPPKLAWTPVPNTMLLTIRCNLATFAGYKTFQMQQLFHFAGLLALHAFQKFEHRELSAPPNIMQLGQSDCIMPCFADSDLQWYHDEPTGISLTAAAMGIPARPRSTLASHWCMVRGVVLANSPRNCTMMNWKMTVLVRTAMKT